MEQIARVFEWAGVAVIVAAAGITVWASILTYRASGAAAAYVAGRGTFGRGLLIGLEVFVAADLIRTLSVDLTLRAVGSLGLLVGDPDHSQLLDRRRDQRRASLARPRGRTHRRLTPGERGTSAWQASRRAGLERNGTAGSSRGLLPKGPEGTRTSTLCMASTR